MFEVALASFAIFAAMTLATEYRRKGGVTPLLMLTVSNGIYCVVTPAISYFSPESTPIFHGYVEDAGVFVSDEGLFRVVLAAAVFQLTCWAVALSGQRFTGETIGKAEKSNEYLSAAILIGWSLVLVGGGGAICLGLNYNQQVFGLYQIAYGERSSFFRENGGCAFLLLLGTYGASQLIAAYVLTGSVKKAGLIFLLVAFHGMGIKSKFPIFWTLLVFAAAALGAKVNLRKFLLPLISGGAVLFFMSALRGLENPTDFLDYIDAAQERSVHFWENDIPGPSSITYFLVNDRELEYSLAPLLEVPKLLIPRFLYDRGDVLPEIWAAKMLGISYEPGMGFGWSLLCDGYLLGGVMGVIALAYLISRLARVIGDAAMVCDGQDRIFRHVIMYTSIPIFFLGFRESFAGLIKALLIIMVTVWIPTVLLISLRRLRSSHGAAT